MRQNMHHHIRYSLVVHGTRGLTKAGEDLPCGSFCNSRLRKITDSQYLFLLPTEIDSASLVQKNPAVNCRAENNSKMNLLFGNEFNFFLPLTFNGCIQAGKGSLYPYGGRKNTYETEHETKNKNEEGDQ